MKSKLICAITFLLFSNIIFSQLNMNNMSVELNYGYNGAIQPYNKQFKSNFSGFNHFEVGIRYMFSEHLGAKIIYKSDKFVNDPGGNIGIQYNSLGAGVVYNIGKKIGLTYLTRDNLGLLFHLEGSVGFANSLIQQYESEKTKIIGIGITPQYRINNKIAITTDFTYNINLKQLYGFDGFPINTTKISETGSFYNLSIGLIYYIGENKYHSDWY
jgi:hypothetical protein